MTIELLGSLKLVATVTKAWETSGLANIVKDGGAVGLTSAGSAIAIPRNLGSSNPAWIFQGNLDGEFIKKGAVFISRIEDPPPLQLANSGGEGSAKVLEFSAMTAVASDSDSFSTADKAMASLGTTKQRIIADAVTLNGFYSPSFPSTEYIKLPQAIRDKGPFLNVGSDGSFALSSAVLNKLASEVSAFARPRLGLVVAEFSGEARTIMPQQGRYGARQGGGIKAEGQTAMTVPATLYLYRDVVTHEVFAYTGLATGTGGASTSALDASNMYNKQLREARLDLLQGKPPTLPPVERPAFTLDPTLSPEERAIYDAWWTHAVSERAALATAAAGLNNGANAADRAYKAYTDEGGALDRDGYNKALNDAKQSTDGTESGSTWTKDLADLLGTGVGTVGKVLEAGVSGTSDVLKSWGPLGTAGAYAGVKAVDTVDDDKPNWLLLGVVGVGLLLVLK